MGEVGIEGGGESDQILQPLFSHRYPPEPIVFF